MNTTIDTAKTNGKATQSTNGRDLAAEAEQEMLYSLKKTIDQGNRYKYRIDDISMGYAVGKGIDPVDARFEVIDKFENKFGKDPLAYSDQVREQRQQNSRENSRSSGRGR